MDPNSNCQLLLVLLYCDETIPSAAPVSDELNLINLSIIYGSASGSAAGAPGIGDDGGYGMCV